MIVVLAGHVDHGKTALVKALTGVDTDSLAEEKRRGLTIDLGFAYADLNGLRVGFVDVPGHHRFIQNMIAGVATHQHALLVIAADDGIMPQTREHLQILSFLKVQQGTVVITKVDLVDDQRIAELKQSLPAFLSGTCLEGASVLCTSTYSGEGIDSLKTALSDAAAGYSTQKQFGCFRMGIDRSFSLTGQGTIVTGTISSGQIKLQDQLRLTGQSNPVRVRGLRVNDKVADSASIGDRCGINISGVDSKQISRGDWLCGEDGYLAVNRVLVNLEVDEDFPRDLKHWNSVHAYQGTFHTEARIGLLGKRTLSRGETAVVEVVFDSVSYVKVNDSLILRDRDLQRTIGGGVVQAIPQRLERSRTENQYWLKCVNSTSKTEPSSLLTAVSSNMLLDLEHFRRSWNLTEEEFESVVSGQNLIRRDQLALSRDRFQELAARVSCCIGEYHKKHDDSPGVNQQFLTKQLMIERDELEFVLEELVADRKLKLNQGQYAFIDFVQSKIQFNKALFERIEPLIDRPHPMSLGDLGKELRMPLRGLEQETRKMAKAGVVVSISNRRLLHPLRLRRFIEIAKTLSARDELTVARFRDQTQLGRNAVVELLEYFDRVGFTRREADKRVVKGDSAATIQ